MTKSWTFTLAKYQRNFNIIEKNKYDIPEIKWNVVCLLRRISFTSSLIKGHIGFKNHNWKRRRRRSKKKIQINLKTIQRQKYFPFNIGMTYVDLHWQPAVFKYYVCNTAVMFSMVNVMFVTQQWYSSMTYITWRWYSSMMYVTQHWYKSMTYITQWCFSSITYVTKQWYTSITYVTQRWYSSITYVTQWLFQV